MTTRYSKEDLDTVIALCRVSAERLTESADARHLCEQHTVSDDINSTFSFANDAHGLAKSAGQYLFELRAAALPLIARAEPSDDEKWSTPDRLRRLCKVADLSRAQAGGTPSVDWGHAAELRFYADTLSRCAWAPEEFRDAQDAGTTEAGELAALLATSRTKL